MELGVTARESSRKKKDSEYKFGSRADFLPYLLTAALNPLFLEQVNTYAVTGGLVYILLVILFWVFIATPILYLEVFMGQYCKRTYLSSWRMSPMSYGLVFFFSLSNMVVYVYHFSILMYVFYVFLQIFNNKLPWKSCNEGYGNISKCVLITQTNNVSFEGCYQKPDPEYWYSIVCPENGSEYELSTSQYANYMFLDTHVRRGEWDSSLVTLCNIIMWIILYAIVSWRSYRLKKMVKSNLILFTALLATLFILSVLVGGASVARQVRKYLFYKGIRWADLKLELYSSLKTSVTVLGICTPVHWTYSTRLSYRSKPVHDAILVSSFMFFIAFCFNILCLTVTEVVSSKLGLVSLQVPRISQVFLAYIPAFIELTTTSRRFWLIVIYMLFTYVSFIFLAVQMNGLLNNLLVATDTMDYRQYVTTGYCLLMATVTSLLIYPKNALTFKIMNLCLVLHGLLPTIQFVCESVTVFWVYGRVCDDVHFMTGEEPNIFWKTCWNICPFIGIFHSYILWNKIESTTYLKQYLHMDIIFYIVPIFLVWGIITKGLSFIRQGKSAWWIFEPTPDWGPPNRPLRDLRKRFDPRTNIRSQPITGQVFVKQSFKDQ